MEGRKEYHLKNICELLTLLEGNLRRLGKNHYYDLHSGAEDPVCGLLNRLFGYRLVNLNNEQLNYPGIDLADRERRVAVQVTTDGAREKITGTLTIFDRADIRAAFDRLVIIVMGRKPAYRKAFDTRGLNLEILSLDELSRIIAGKEEAVVEDIACYLREAFVFRSNGEPPRLRVDHADEDALLEQLSVLQENYLHRFRSAMTRGGACSLSLEELYIPNPYLLGSSTKPRSDLMELAEHFIRGDLNRRLSLPAENEEVTTLVVEGQQCTGKSTLVASILHRAYFRWGMKPDRIHLLSFGERELRSVRLTARGICDYLDLESDRRLRDAVVIIDAFDESDWSSQGARRQLENLMEDLIKYRCRLLVTTRTNYLDTTDMQGILNITLCPFTLAHADRWLDVYGSCNPGLDVESLKADLRSIPAEVRNVILLPHVLQVCVTHGIALGSVVNLNQLYDLVFRGPRGLFMRDQYFPNPHAQHRRMQKMLGTAVQISMRCMQQGNRISARDLEAYIAQGGPEMERLKTEYLLEKRDGDYYAFAHNTIPSYLIAMDVYEAFSGSAGEVSDQQILARIAPVVTAGNVLTGAVIHSLEQMSRRDEPGPGDRAQELLKKFLTDRLEADVLSGSGGFAQARQRYELWFDALVRVTLALKAAWWSPEGEYRFFETLEPEAAGRFSLFFNRNPDSDRSWDYIRHCMMDNWTLTDINLSRTVMPSKRIRAMVMHGAQLDGIILRGAYILDSDLSASSMEGANCNAVQFSNSLLCAVSFRGAKLRGARFVGCDLSHADLRDTDLRNVYFENCVLTGVRINAQQLHDHYGLFDLETIQRQGIRLYMDECELPEDLVADEYRRQRPVTHSIRHNKTVFSGGNIRKAELVRRVIENHAGSISTAQILAACPRVSQSTVQRVLSNLQQSGQISKVGGGYRTAYIWNKK